MKNMAISIIGSLCIIFFSQVTATADGPAAIEENKLREIVKEVIKENPKLIYDTVNNYTRNQRKKKQEKLLEESFKNRVKDPVADNNPTKGPEDALITIIEYTDFECPYCARGANTVDKIMRIYPEKVRLVFKNLPLSFHKQAIPAARAALAAGKQGKFWQYHDLLFKNFSGLNEGMFLNFARDLGFDMGRFNTDRNSEEIAKQIQSEQAQAAVLKLTGTPAFVVNGVVIRGAQSLDYFKGVIDRLLLEKNKN